MVIGGVKVTSNNIKKKKLTLRIDTELDKEIETAAKELGLSKNAFIVLVLKKHYKNAG